MALIVIPWLAARMLVAVAYAALLPIGALLYLGTEMVGTPNVENLLSRIAMFAVTPITTD